MIFLVTKTSTSMPPTSSEGWQSYTKFKSSLERIGNKAYRDSTGDFRNSYQHRFSDLTSTSMPPTSSEGWQSYTKFKSSLERIGNKAYRDSTGDFRNSYQHRF